MAMERPTENTDKYEDHLGQITLNITDVMADAYSTLTREEYRFVLISLQYQLNKVMRIMNARLGNAE